MDQKFLWNENTVFLLLKCWDLFCLFFNNICPWPTKLKCSSYICKMYFFMAVIGAQLPERSLLTPEVLGSNPVIVKELQRPWAYFWLFKRRQKRKRGRKWPIPKLIYFLISLQKLFRFACCANWKIRVWVVWTSR